MESIHPAKFGSSRRHTLSNSLEKIRCAALRTTQSRKPPADNAIELPKLRQFSQVHDKYKANTPYHTLQTNRTPHPRCPLTRPPSSQPLVHRAVPGSQHPGLRMQHPPQSTNVSDGPRQFCRHFSTKVQKRASTCTFCFSQPYTHASPALQTDISVLVCLMPAARYGESETPLVNLQTQLNHYPFAPTHSLLFSAIHHCTLCCFPAPMSALPVHQLRFKHQERSFIRTERWRSRHHP
jgi:hypothetical protein